MSNKVHKKFYSIFRKTYNMKKLLLLSLIILSTISYSQSSKIKRTLKKVNFKIRNYDSSQPIVIERVNNDQSDLVGEFEMAFFDYNFNVISNTVAKEIIKFNNPLESGNQNITVQKYNSTSAIYKITISGTQRRDTGCGGTVPSRVNGRIVDLLNGGALVGTFRFKQGSFEGKCSYDVAQAVAYKLKYLTKK